MVKKWLSSLAAQLMLLTAVGLILTMAFNNCARLGGFGMMESMDLAITHPAEAPPLYATQVRNQVAEKSYVMDVMRTIFVGPLMTRPQVDAILDKWVEIRGGYWGGGCNVYDTFSLRACGTSTPFSQVGNSQVSKSSEQVTPSVVRESYHVQICENLLGTEAGLRSAMEKIEHSEIPTPAAMEQIYEIFYREETPGAFLSVLKKMDQDLAADDATPDERWRMLFLLVCESPGWQVL